MSAKVAMRIGTSAFTAAGWPGTFYPEDAKPADYLSLYAEHFDAVEVDSTYYRIPSASTVKGWHDKTPPGFVFAAKIPQIITHEKILGHCVSPRRMRRAIFNKERAAEIFVETLFDHRRRGMYLLHDFVVMPDHFHSILTPAPTLSLEKVVQLIKRGSSHRIGKEFRMKFRVWQAGFHEHWIRSAEDCGRCQQFIRENPVKARLTEIADDYIYPSAGGKFELDRISFASGAKAQIVATAVTAGLKPRPAKANPIADRDD